MIIERQCGERVRSKGRSYTRRGGTVAPSEEKFSQISPRTARDIYLALLIIYDLVYLFIKLKGKIKKICDYTSGFFFLFKYFYF